MSKPREDPEPPRLQDTTERSALPLPLPGSDEPAPMEDAPAADKAASVQEPAAQEPVTDETPAVEQRPADEEPAPTEHVAAETVSAAEGVPSQGPSPADKSASVQEPANESPNGAAAAPPPPYEPPSPALGADLQGMRPEVLVGAAFVGGLALALLIRRLGH